MKEDLVKLLPGDATLTRRILKRSREAGLECRTETELVRIGGGRFGTKVVAYHVPSDIYREEVERREREKRKKQQDDDDRRENDARQRREKAVDELCAKFPKLSRSQIADLYDQHKIVKSFDETGYLEQLATKSYWRNLGYDVSGDPVGIAIRGKRCFDLYRTHQLRERKSRLGFESLKDKWLKLKDKWLKKYGSSELALAEALKCANRLQKIQKKDGFYSLKDRWIKSRQHLLIEGKLARVEERMCWSCDGSGIYYQDEECWKCGGTGVYSSRTLYEHVFEIEGRVFSFHSYVRPRLVGEERGADLPVYGQPFRSEELPLPPQSMLIRLIEDLL